MELDRTYFLLKTFQNLLKTPFPWKGFPTIKNLNGKFLPFTKVLKNEKKILKKTWKAKTNHKGFNQLRIKKIRGIVTLDGAEKARAPR